MNLEFDDDDDDDDEVEVNRYNGDVVCCTKTRLPYVYTRHAGWRRLITVYHCIIHSVLVRSRCRITGSIAWWQVDD